jgi:hypothetical protein
MGSHVHLERLEVRQLVERADGRPKEKIVLNSKNVLNIGVDGQEKCLK